MTNERILALLTIERECIWRNKNGCEQHCSSCDLIQDTDELLEMYDTVIERMVNKYELGR